MENSIYLEIEGDGITLDELIATNNVDGDEVITADDIARITALKAGESTVLENSHTGGTIVTRIDHLTNPS